MGIPKASNYNTMHRIFYYLNLKANYILLDCLCFISLFTVTTKCYFFIYLYL